MQFQIARLRTTFLSLFAITKKSLPALSQENRPSFLTGRNGREVHISREITECPKVYNGLKRTRRVATLRKRKTRMIPKVED